MQAFVTRIPEGHRGIAGLGLEGIWSYKGKDHDDYVARLFERQRDFVLSLCAPDETRVYDLRVIVEPDLEMPMRGKGTVALLVGVQRPTAKEAAAAALGLRREIAALLQAIADEYQFGPVDGTALRACLVPFRAEDAVEIVRREAFLPLDAADRPRAPAIGFPTGRTPARDRARPASVYHAFPLIPRNATFATLLRVLLHHSAPVMLSVRLHPTRLRLTEARALRESIELCERYSRLGLGRVSDPNAADAVRSTLQGQAAALRDVLARQLHGLEDSAFEVHVRLASPAPLPSTLIEAVATEISRPAAAVGPTAGGQPGLHEGGTSWTRVAPTNLGGARKELATLDATPWAFSAAPVGQRRLLRLYDVQRATSCFHLPVPLPGDFPGLATRRARTVLPPRELPVEGLLLGHAVHGSTRHPVHLPADDRRRHCYIVGQTGTGKSTLFLGMALQDIRAGRGVGVIDPHGDLIDQLLPRIPKERADDVLIIDPADHERPVGLNLLEWETQEQCYFLVQEMVAILYKLFPPEMIGPMFEHNVRNALLTLMADRENPGTLVEIPRIFADKDYHKRYLPKVKDQLVRDFWEKEIARTSDFHRSEILGYLVSKFDRFVGEPTMRNMIGQQHSTVDFRKVMDERRILLVDLSKGTVGEIPSALLGMLVVARITSATLAREAVPMSERVDFHLYVDEFQNLATSTFATVLSEARKYRLNLTLTNQFLTQIPDTVRDAVFGNVGTLLAFRVGVTDAAYLGKQFAPTFLEEDLLNLPNWHAYTTLLGNGQRLPPFCLATSLEQSAENAVMGEAIRQHSRLKIGRDRALVEAELHERLSGPKREAIFAEAVA